MDTQNISLTIVSKKFKFFHTEEVAACWDRQPAPAGAHGGMAPPAEEGGEALPIDDPRCIVEPKARDYRCPGFVGP